MYLTHIRTGTHTHSFTHLPHTHSHTHAAPCGGSLFCLLTSFLAFPFPFPPASPHYPPLLLLLQHTLYSPLCCLLPFPFPPSPLSLSLLALLDPLPNAQMLSSFAFSAKYSRLHSSCLPAPLPATLPTLLLPLVSLTTHLLLLLNPPPPLVISYCSYFSFFFRPAFCTFDFDKLLLRFRPQAIFIAIFIRGLIE